MQAPTPTATEEAAEAGTGAGDVAEHQRRTRVTWADSDDLELVKVFDVSADSRSPHVQLCMLGLPTEEAASCMSIHELFVCSSRGCQRQPCCGEQ